MIRAAAIGALATIVLAFPMAALMALVYRFPVPFGGYVSGPTAVPLALMGVVFYGALGGFFVLGGLGCAAGIAAHRMGRTNDKRVVTLALELSLLIAFAVIFTLAILDKLIGPW